MVTSVSDGQEATTLLRSRHFDVVVAEMSGPRGFASALRHIMEAVPASRIVLVSRRVGVGSGDEPSSPSLLDVGSIVDRVRQIAQRTTRPHDVREWRGTGATSTQGLPELVTVSARMREVVSMVPTVAACESSVIVTGESGTGKELLCRLIHNRSARRNGPFVIVNCAAFPETLIEAELFGHEKGAFTGAARSRPGRFRAANGGTLVLDEIGEIPLRTQVRLLRVVEDGMVETLGADTPQRVNVRLLACTHRDLRKLVEEGRFRLDLFYRLKVFELHLPPLRGRTEDIPALVDRIMQRLLPPGAPLPSLSRDMLEALRTYPFPGNVRELSHALEHALAVADSGPLEPRHLPPDITGSTPSPWAAERGPSPFMSLADALRGFERVHLLEALRRAGGHRTRAAELLGISRKTLWVKLNQHGIGFEDIVSDR